MGQEETERWWQNCCVGLGNTIAAATGITGWEGATSNRVSVVRCAFGCRHFVFLPASLFTFRSIVRFLCVRTCLRAPVALFHRRNSRLCSGATALSF